VAGFGRTSKPVVEYLSTVGIIPIISRGAFQVSALFYPLYPQSAQQTLDSDRSHQKRKFYAQLLICNSVFVTPLLFNETRLSDVMRVHAHRMAVCIPAYLNFALPGFHYPALLFCMQYRSVSLALGHQVVAHSLAPPPPAN